MDFLLAKLLPTFFYPLSLALLLQFAALLGRQRRWSPWVSAAALLLLWVASMPWVSRSMERQIEQRALALVPPILPKADAVLVLGGGVLAPLPPRRGVEISDAGDRLLTGVQLMRENKAQWLLVSGGVVSLRGQDPAPPEAQSAATLARWLGVDADRILMSDQARNTAEEARALQTIATARNWRSVLLVTSARHLPRSVATFRRLTALKIVPVACDFHVISQASTGSGTAASLLDDVLPNAGALSNTSTNLRELMGLVVYKLRGWS
jgi:uncharacterized SAM-binding protein YcdF (DUF218 family)